MEIDKSFGIIPIRKQDGIWQTFVIQHKAGHWGFPKGHADLGEEPKETAERELNEETNLKIKKYYPIEPLISKYKFTKGRQLVNKIVTYFVAEVKGDLHLCPVEIQDGEWLDLKDAADKINFKDIEPILARLKEFLKAL